jgi:LysR family nitrogen assimilation transcriptional regulator
MRQSERDVTLRQLRTFVCVARAGNFSRAAAELGISQPAVSDQIAMLEGRLGHSLFRRRQGTTPLLTLEGTKLLEKAGNVLDATKAMRREESRQTRQNVRISIGPRLRESHLRPMLPRLYREHPGVSVESVPVIPWHDVQAALESGKVDLVVYTLGQMAESWQNARLISDVPTVLAGPRGMTERLRSGEARIEDQQFFLPSTGNLMENWIEQQLEQLGIRPTLPIVYLEFPDVIQELVEDGQGVTVLMREQLAASIAAGKLETIGPAFPPMQRFIARSNRAPQAAHIIEQRLVEAMGETARLLP